MTPFSLREKVVGLVIIVMTGINVGPAMATDDSGPYRPSYKSQTASLFEEIERRNIIKELQDRELEIQQQELELERQARLAEEKQLRLAIVAEALTYVGQVRYVLTGSTPTGWDCSGFVRYVFGKFGHELAHSASAQKRSGLLTGVPQPGDLVAFDRGQGTEHIGIYVGDGMLVEATVETGTTRAVDIGKAYPKERGWKLSYVNLFSDGVLE